VKHASLICAVAALFLVFTALVHGQAVTGSLVGTVTDSSGGTVANAKVTITAVNTGISRTAQTNESGNFTFPALEPGVYRVSVEQAGFRTAVKDGVNVLLNTTVRADLSLQPGAVNETVTVTAEVPIMQTDRSDTGRKIEAVQIVDMPLGFNRNFQSLLNLVPGAGRSYRPHSEFFNSQDSLSIQVNGNSRLANNVQFEGVDNNHRTGLLSVLIPPIEALETVDVSTSNYEAELGRAGGAVTNIVLRSGTNQLHGGVYWFHKDSRLGAREFFATRKPVTTYNYYGFNVGGPIRKNKTFFFGDYLGVKDRRGDIFPITVPPSAFRAGDFSSATSRALIYDPASGQPNGTGRQPFSGNVIPAARFSPISQKILALLPTPNLVDSFQGPNYETGTVRIKDTESFDTKVDHQQTDKDRFSVRYSFQRPVVTDPPLFGPKGAGGGKEYGGTGVNRTQSAAVNYTRLFSPTLIMEARVGVSRYANVADIADVGNNTADAVGIKGANLDRFSSGITTMNISGYSNPLIGYSASLPWNRAETNINFVNNWTKILRNHTIKFGADIRRIRDELLQVQTYGGPRGIYNWRNLQTSIQGAPVLDQANSFASFLLDVPNDFGRDLPVIFPAYRATGVFTYIQDKWQVTPKLTLDLGLRHELWPPATPRLKGGFSNYDFDANSLVIAGIGSNPMNLGRQTYYKSFAPRLGIAYRFNPKTVVRTGFGMSYFPFPDNTYAYNFPVKQNNVYSNLTAYGQAVLPDGRFGSMATGFATPQPAVIPNDGIIRNAPLNQDFFTIPKNYKEGYVESWNFAVQRLLPGNFTLDVAYVGNHTVRGQVNYEVNASRTINTGAAGRPLFQKFNKNTSAGIRYVGFSNNYNSMQIKVDRRFSGGFLLTTAYTWGKAMGYAPESSGLQYYIDMGRNYAPLNFTRGQTFVQSYVYQLPFGKNKRWLKTGVARWVLGDWQVNGILTLMTGTPLDFGTSVSINSPGNGNSPDLIAPVKFIKDVGPGTQWFDPSSFGRPVNADGTPRFGNLGRYILQGPGLRDFDFSLFRNFQITERIKGELRAESFNFTNTPIFGNPNTSQGNANFGRVTGTVATNNGGGPRSIQLGIRLSF